MRAFLRGHRAMIDLLRHEIGGQDGMSPSSVQKMNVPIRVLLLTPPKDYRHRLKTSLSSGLESFGLKKIKIIMPDTTVGDGGLISPSEADGVIADLTDDDANVMYNVGFAHGMKKPVFIIRQDTKSIPFDLTEYLYCTYDMSFTGLAGLSDQVHHWFRRTFRDRLS
jgi:hypothetical protein